VVLDDHVGQALGLSTGGVVGLRGEGGGGGVKHMRSKPGQAVEPSHCRAQEACNND
jgi:hypothetical protein